MSIYKRFLAIVLIAFLIPLQSLAQKKQINQARDILKEAKEPQKAEELMRGLLADSIHRPNLRLWTLLVNSMVMQYEQANEKLYLKQELDTAAFFRTTKSLFADMQGMDTIDARPDKKGRIAPKYRERHATYLNAIRPNLNTGGVFFMRKQDYRQALTYFDQYLDCAQQPLFTSFDYEHTDRDIPAVANRAMSCAYYLKDADLMLKYLPMARLDSTDLDHVYLYQSEACKLKGDTVQYVAALQQGFARNPANPYFFPRLVEYYERAGQLDSAMWVVEWAIQADSANVLSRYAKSTLLLNMGRYEECIQTCKELLAENDSLSDVYYNLGLSYFNQAIHKEKQLMLNHAKRSVRQNEKRQIANLYAQSLPYLLRYRNDAPDEVEKWSSPLYTIYFNLNMGKEFDEIDKLRNEYRKKQ